MKRSISIAMLMVFILMLVTMGSALAQDPPVGAIVMWPTGTAPDGWLLCNGQAVSRTQYSALYNVITTTFGAGNGSTTFNLPNFTGRSPQGPDASASEAVATPVGVKLQTNVPQHRHAITVRDPGAASPYVRSAPETGGTANTAYTAYTGVAGGIDQRGPRLVVNFIIKYEESASTPTPTPTATPTPGPTPTLTPTPLPEWVITDTLSSGTVVMVDRSVSYGHVITAGVLLAAAALALFGVVQREARH